jgi:hypothetical protein
LLDATAFAGVAHRMPVTAIGVTGSQFARISQLQDGYQSCSWMGRIRGFHAGFGKWDYSRIALFNSYVKRKLQDAWDGAEFMLRTLF